MLFCKILQNLLTDQTVELLYYSWRGTKIKLESPLPLHVSTGVISKRLPCTCTDKHCSLQCTIYYFIRPT